MNKTLLKNFATQARVGLMKDVAYRLGLMGITAKGTAQPSVRQPGMEAYEYAKGEQFKLFGADVDARRHLAEQARAKGFDQLVEEVTYTWFNRLIAVRFMEVNDYLPTHTRVLSSVTPGQSVPDIVTHALEIDLGLTAKEKEQVLLWKLESKVDNLFRFLFLKQCDQLSKILPGLFIGYHSEASYSPYDNQDIGFMGFTEDPYKLLLTLSCTSQDGLVVRLLKIPEDYFNVSALDEEDQPIGQVEIIGWMYQFYNTELKDDTFEQLKKNVKIPKERIPAATQLFTPHWIVRYMVENSLGRLWVEKLLAQGDRRSEAEIAKAFGWDYYLPEAEQPPEVQATLKEQRKERVSLRLEDICLLDPCMGSGHILVYAFDVLMQLYLSSGYTQRDAAKLIVEKNLWGIDIDERAWQLSHFAILMKARQYNRQALNTISFTHLYPVRDTRGWSKQLLDHIAGADRAMRDDLDTLKAAFAEAETLGSIIRPPAIDSEKLYEHWRGDILGHYHHDIESRILQQQAETHFLPVLLQLRALEQKYHVVVTNPPYMGSSGMNNLLSSYVKEEYPDSKSDLFAVFIERCGEMLRRDGYQAMITQHAWMFLSSYEKLRERMFRVSIVNMAHLGARAFDEIGGEVVQTTSFVLHKSLVPDFRGVYRRLIEPITQQGKEEMFLSTKNRFTAAQAHFSKIPGAPISYWVGDKVYQTFSNDKIENSYILCQGLTTTDNDKYVRVWFEVMYHHISFNSRSSIEAIYSRSRWFPFNKGGSFRKWFGNKELIVDYEDDGKKIKTDVLRKYPYLKTPDFVVKNSQYYFQEGLTWSALSSGSFSIRWADVGSICADKGQGLFASSFDLLFPCGYLNSSVASMFMDIISPTLDYNCGYLRKLPFIAQNCEVVNQLVKNNISISRTDWDSFETSWDFQRHPMV